MTKKISKVIIYYDDGTYEEVKASLLNPQDQQDKAPTSPSPVMPGFRPDYQKVRDWKEPYYTQPQWVPSTDKKPWEPPFTVTCDNVNVPLKYTINSDNTWSFTSTGNADNLNKYTITSTGNGNVDLSK